MRVKTTVKRGFMELLLMDPVETWSHFGMALNFKTQNTKKK